MIFFIIWRDVWQIYSHTDSNCSFSDLSFTCNIPPEKSRNDSFLLTLTLSWLFFIYCTNTHVISIDITHYLLYQYTCNRYWHYTLFSLSKIMQMLLNMYLEFNHLTQNIKFFLCDAVCVLSLIQCNHMMLLNTPLSGHMPTIVLVEIKFNVCIIMTAEKCKYITLYFPLKWI